MLETQAVSIQVRAYCRVFVVIRLGEQCIVIASAIPKVLCLNVLERIDELQYFAAFVNRPLVDKPVGQLFNALV